jgi:GNAT superfamily N-acetyltransferase
MSATFLAWLSERLGTPPGVLDLVLAAPARARAPEDAQLVRRDDLTDHPRVARATRYRNDLHVYTDETGQGVLVVGRGLAGRWEMAFEVDADARGRGLGRALAAVAPTLIPEGEHLFAQASPGNAASRSAPSSPPAAFPSGRRSCSPAGRRTLQVVPYRHEEDQRLSQRE